MSGVWIFASRTNVLHCLHLLAKVEVKDSKSLLTSITETADPCTRAGFDQSIWKNHNTAMNATSSRDEEELICIGRNRRRFSNSAHQNSITGTPSKRSMDSCTLNSRDTPISRRALKAIISIHIVGFNASTLRPVLLSGERQWRTADGSDKRS